LVREKGKRTREAPEVRQARILKEAIRILGQRGYHGFTVQELAERCGLSNAGLLYHFPSKEQLFVAVVQELEHREIQVLAPLVAVVERTGAPLTAVIELLHTMVARGSTEPELVRLYAVLQSESLDKAHPAHDSFRRREEQTLTLFAKLVAPHVPRPLSTARQMLALVDGLRLQWLRADQGFDPAAEWVMAVTALVPALAPLRDKYQVSVRASAAPKSKVRRAARNPKRK
jgi:AcrR family transcriptional regulator